MRMRRKSAVSLVGRVAMRMRMAVSSMRLRLVRHRTRIRITVLGLPSKRKNLLSTAESNSSIFGRSFYLLELRRYGRMDKNKQRDCESLAMAGC